MSAQPAGSALAGSAIHEDWVAKYRTPEAQRFYEVAFDEIVRRLNAPAGATILDAGCGSCAKSVLLAKRGFHVVATDFSENALAMAQGTIAEEGVAGRVTLRKGDLLNLPFGDGEFQYAICWGVLMHVPELEQALAQLARVLAPGGLLVISEGNMHSVESVLLRALRRVLRRGRGRRQRTAAGIECHEQTSQGDLITRQTDMSWMVRHGQHLGLQISARCAGQFTELYTLAPWGLMRRAIHRFNDLWFRFVRLPGPAYGNILIFRKQERPAA